MDVEITMPQLTRHGIELPAILGSTATFQPRLLPEDLDVEIIMRGYSYTVVFAGSMVDQRTLLALKASQPLPVNHDEWMESQAVLGRQLSGMRRFRYIGNGRFDLDQQLRGELTSERPEANLPNNQVGTASLLSLVRGNDGHVTISSAERLAQSFSDLKHVSFEAKGTVRIKAAGSIIRENAQARSSDDTYIWENHVWHDQLHFRFSPRTSVSRLDLEQAQNHV